MSGFCGELSLSDGRPDEKGPAAMDSAMGFWGPDAAGRWQEGPIVLGARLVRVTPEDALDLQPLVEPDLALVGHVRLDDREALGRAVGLDPADTAALPDSQLVVRAWRRWGKGCAEHLYGDWVCAIWDRTRRSLWLARDAAGNTCLYYWRDGSRLVFSTSLKALLAHPDVPRQPNAYRIARQLAVVTDPSEDASTAYVGVHRLPGGHALRCHHSNVEPYEWWHPEHLSELDWASEEDYYGAFRQLYDAAVAGRLRKASGPVGLMLSAGLDSGSVASLSAPRLAARGERLLAYTSVPRFQPDGAGAGRLGDEGTLAKATADHVGDTDFVPVASGQSGIVASIEAKLAVHDQAGHAAANYYWVLDILRLARDRGVRVLLTGQGGNATVSWTGIGNLWPALRGGDWSALRSAFRDSEVGGWLTLKRQILTPALLPVRDAVRRLRHSGRAPWAGYSAIHPHFAAEIDLRARMRAAGHDPHFGAVYDDRHPRIARFRLCRLGSAHAGATWMELGAAHQIDVPGSAWLNSHRTPRRSVRFLFPSTTPPICYGTASGMARRWLAVWRPGAAYWTR